MAESSARVLRVLRAARHAVRDGWLIFGLALLFCIALEVVYRTQAEVRTWLRRLTPEGPVAGSTAGTSLINLEPWWPELHARQRELRRVYDPYRAWWGKPTAHPFQHVDSLGRRRTVDPDSMVPKHYRIVLMGGSTMWGYEARDEHTIPSLVAGGLHRLGVEDVEVVNLAQIGFNATQELATLILELRAGRIPHVVVFLDGHNEVAEVYMTGEYGGVAGQAEAAAILTHRRRLWTDLLELGDYSRLVARLKLSFGIDEVPPPAAPAPEVACPRIAAAYRQLVIAAEALGARFGFEPLFYWQPLLATTGKTLTPYEASRPLVAEGYGEMLRRCTAAVDSALVGLVTYHSLTGLLDAHTETVFVDHAAHLTERANGEVAARMLRDIVPRLPPPPDAKASPEG